MEQQHRYVFSSREWPGPIKEGNPQFGSRMKLVSDTGYYLAVLPDGHVKGVDEDTDRYTILNIHAAGVGEVQLQGVETGLYLAMDDRGLLHGTKDSADSSTVFLERPLGQHNTYQSKTHRGWYVAIKKTGVVKPGPHTKPGQRATKFLPIRQ